MIDNLTQEQARILVERFEADPALRALDADTVPCPPAAAMAAMGTPYRLAGVDVPPPSLEALARLALIESPLLTGETEDVSAMDCWRSLFALVADRADLAPLLGLSGRLRTLHEFAARYPEMSGDIVPVIDQAAAAAWAAIDAAALDMAARYPGASAQDVADLILVMLADAADAWARVPREASRNDEKKKASPPCSTATGSAACSRSASPPDSPKPAPPRCRSADSGSSRPHTSIPSPDIPPSGSTPSANAGPKPSAAASSGRS